MSNKARCIPRPIIQKLFGGNKKAETKRALIGSGIKKEEFLSVIFMGTKIPNTEKLFIVMPFKDTEDVGYIRECLRERVNKYVKIVDQLDYVVYEFFRKGATRKVNVVLDTQFMCMIRDGTRFFEVVLGTELIGNRCKK